MGLPGAGNLVVANGEDGIDVSGSDFNLVSGNAVGTTLFTMARQLESGPPRRPGQQERWHQCWAAQARPTPWAVSHRLDPSGQFTIPGGNLSVEIRRSGSCSREWIKSREQLTRTSQSGISCSGISSGPAPMAKDPVANGNDGILLGNSAENTIGGANGFYPDGTISSLSGNLISGNAVCRVELNGNSTTGNLVLGNRIGMDLAGTRHVPNVRKAS